MPARTSPLFVVSLLVLCALGSGACKRSGAPAGALKKKAGEKVGKIVFVGKKDACDCTKARVKGSWASLQQALGSGAGVKVERVDMVADVDQVETMKLKRRFMVLPALYFYNPQGKLVAMLEGELSAKQIREQLK